MLRSALVLVLLIVAVASALESRKKGELKASEVFRQYNSTILTYRGLPPTAQWGSLPFASPVRQSLWSRASSSFLLLTQDGSLYVTDVNGGTFQKLSSIVTLPTTKMAIRNDGATVAFVTIMGQQLQVSQCVLSASAAPVCWTALGMVPPNTKTITLVHAVAFTINGTLAVGTDAGFALVAATSTSVAIRLVPLANTTGTVVTTSDATALWCNENTSDTCYVVTTDHFVTSNAWTTALVHVVINGSRFYFHRTPGYIDARPTAFVRDEGRGALHMLNAQCDNVLNDNGTFYRVEGFHGGLPQQNLTAGGYSVSGSGKVWMGSVFGAMVLSQDWTWKYFYGPRWLPGEGFTAGMNVTSLAVGVASNGDDVTLVTTDGGISLIRSISWSFQQKAAHYEAIRDARHNRHGLCTGVRLQQFGNISSWVEQHTANDGLWTSLYVASQAFRYAATKDPIAKRNAWEAFEGMQLLINVTGQLGYPARSARQAQPCPNGWYPSPTKPGWCFMSDTSSDEIVGHLHVYPIVFELVAETAWEKAAAAATMSNVLSYIVDNNFTLVDPVTGKETSWGRWQPAELNYDPDWYDDRGPNSNQIVTYLAQGYRITGNPKFLNAFHVLVDENRYDLNIVNLKITQPSDINYSDDELTYLPYLSFLLADKMASTNASNPLYERAKQSVWLSITRTQWYVAKGKPALWNAIYSGFSQRFTGATNEKFVRDAKWCLETWPVQLVDWPVNNADRLDIIQDPHHTRSGKLDRLTETLLPFDENPQLMWNSNPFRTEGGSGYQEVDPGPWLYPYWVGVYFGLWY